jgi:hypothetical protein
MGSTMPVMIVSPITTLTSGFAGRHRAERSAPQPLLVLFGPARFHAGARAVSYR